MDLLEAKSRIAEALVESIFRRARYQIRAYRSDTAPLRFGREDFSPDFRVVPGPESAAEDVLVEIKYRPSVAQFVSVEAQRGERSVLSQRSVRATSRTPRVSLIGRPAGLRRDGTRAGRSGGRSAGGRRRRARPRPCPPGRP